MKSKISRPFRYIWANKGKKRVWIPAVIIVLVLLANMGSSKADEGVFVYTVQPKEFVQTVSLTGKVIAAKNVDMGFEASGRVGRVNVKVGDSVRAGQVLASLENGDSVSSLNKNYALVTSEQARLRDIQSGSKIDDITLAENEVTNAQREINLNKQSFTDQVRDVYNKADDSIRFKVDNAFRNPRSANPEFMYFIDQQPGLRESLNTQRLKIGETLTAWALRPDLDNLSNIRKYIADTQKFLNDANTAISAVSEKVSPSDVGYTEVNNKKTDISLARSSFVTSVNALNQAEINYENSRNALTLAEQRLAVKKSGTNTDLDIQKANVQSAQAGVQNAQALIAKTIIRAPFDGVITKVDIKKGEIASPNTPIIGLLNEGEYQIETFVSENDIAKLVVGQEAKITLDAYGRETFFSATVISVDPAETVKDGVSTYRTKIQFTERDPRIKSGMTANIEIETDRRANVLVIPQSAVLLDKGVKKVRVLMDTQCFVEVPEANVATPARGCAELLTDTERALERDIKTGEINNTGDIEVIEGVQADHVLIYKVKGQ